MIIPVKNILDICKFYSQLLTYFYESVLKVVCVLRNKK